MYAAYYPAHVAERQKKAEAALAAAGFDSLVIQAGHPFTYYVDDMDAPFHPTPHFAHWCPLDGPHHLLAIRPNEKPLLVAVKPEDYWYEQTPIGKPFWASQFEIKEVADERSAWKLVAPKGRAAYVGDTPVRAQEHGIAASSCNPQALVAQLDWDRSYKTHYEVECISEAQVIAARGHKAARAAFESGASELEIHQAYVAAAGVVDKDLPYESIIALDQNGAILHYCSKRTQRNGKVLLIDVGAQVHRYASDITRTWTTTKADTLFRELVDGMETLQRKLCAMVRPGLAYLDFHLAAHVAIGDLLFATGILKKNGADALELGLTTPFFPHGLGHFLGIQVHDVAGRQKSPAGGIVPPPREHPYLRTTRTIEEHQVFTVEPGLYFIEMLLRSHRAGPHKDAFDWKTIERLRDHGGIRIEDNVLVTPDGHRNLTRPHV